ncbi:MAG: AAA family ATPase [Chloroflexi bacterium]|nr:AAA family ATPase [Chloroflexota bacterium]
MTPDAHPEYVTETEYLDRTIKAIDNRIAKLTKSHGSAADEDTEECLLTIFSTDVKRLREVRPSPYFARIDFCEAGREELEKYYIGKVGVPGPGTFGVLVVDWRAPICTMFFGKMTDNASFRGPGSVLTGDILLRRRYEIKNSSLERIIDEYDHRPQTTPEEKAAFREDQYLQEALSRKRAAELDEITATIQSEQDTLIRAPADEVLLIQGVAGSGKTSVALQRLAYLLYPGLKTGMRPDRIAVFAPNHLFLSYIGKVLPNLSVDGIRQTTFEDWALRQMGLASYKVDNDYLEELYDPLTLPSARANLVIRNSVKGSLRMAIVLERYVEQRRAAFNPPDQGLVYSDVGPLSVRIEIGRQAMLEIHAQTSSSPLNVHRLRVVNRIHELLEQRYKDAVKAFNPEEPDPKLVEQIERTRSQMEGMQALAEELSAMWPRRVAYKEPPDLAQMRDNLARGVLGLKQAIKRLEQEQTTSTADRRLLRTRALNSQEMKETMDQLLRQIKKDISGIWPALPGEQDYYRLLSTPELLRGSGDDLLTEEEITALASSQRPPKEHIRVEDIPPLYHFHSLLLGHTGQERFHHMVIDEAQDLSPLQFRILHDFAQSATVLGDLAQGVQGSRAIQSWDDVKQIFSDRPVEYAEIPCSYRSTFEITTVANDVMNTNHLAPYLPAQPFHRHGPPPELVQESDTGSMFAAIAQTIHEVAKEDFKSIAVIGKTLRHCRNIAADLRKQKIPNVKLVDSTGSDYQTGIVVIPAYLAKGIEFDVALVVGVDAYTYTSSPEDLHLLYVAMTRPLHRLSLFYVGPLTPLLAPLEQRAPEEGQQGQHMIESSEHR